FVSLQFKTFEFKRVGFLIASRSTKMQAEETKIISLTCIGTNLSQLKSLCSIGGFYQPWIQTFRAQLLDIYQLADIISLLLQFCNRRFALNNFRTKMLLDM
ncbi:hypothetical protein PanWU01x14_099280, partial [Parasponia andersonii]